MICTVIDIRGDYAFVKYQDTGIGKHLCHLVQSESGVAFFMWTTVNQKNFHSCFPFKKARPPKGTG